MIDRENALIPGYVFLFFQAKDLNTGVFRSMNGVIQCLSDMSNQFEMTGADEQFR